MEVKPMNKISGTPYTVQNLGFCHFLKVASLVFLDIAQDCNLGQCLKHLVMPKPEKKSCGPNWDRNDLFYPNMIERLLELVFIFE